MARTIWCLIGLLTAACVSAQEPGSVIVMEIRSGQPTYEIEGKRGDLDELIDLLRARAEETGVSPYEDVAIVLASDKASLEDVRVVHAALGAYGFRDIRLFLFGADKERLVGLSLGIAIPFTKDRGELMRLSGELGADDQRQ